jgi:hypothetical protein
MRLLHVGGGNNLSVIICLINRLFVFIVDQVWQHQKLVYLHENWPKVREWKMRTAHRAALLLLLKT